MMISHSFQILETSARKPLNYVYINLDLPRQKSRPLSFLAAFVSLFLFCQNCSLSSEFRCKNGVKNSIPTLPKNIKTVALNSLFPTTYLGRNHFRYDSIKA